MTELKDIAASFGVSEPVYHVRVTDTDLSFDLVNQYKPERIGEPVHDLLASLWGETLNREDRRFEGSTSGLRAWGEMMGAIRKTMLNVSPLKNPKQSKLYKWLCERDPEYHKSPSPGFIALYRYIKNNNIEDARCENSHAKNVMAILELMKEKHEANNKASSN